MRRRTVSRRFAWTLVVGLVTICSVLSFSRPSLRDALAWTRDGLAADRVWTLVTGHLVHLDASHAALNVAALVLVAWIFSRDVATVGDQLLVLVAGMAAIDAGLWFLHPEIARYVGLSGVLHAWFAAGVVLWLAAGADRLRVGWGIALAFGVVAKLAIEARGLAFWDDGFGWPVVTAAHRWGAAGGAVAGIALVALRRAQAPRGEADPREDR